MNGPPDLARLTAADIVEDLTRTIALLKVGELPAAEQFRLGDALEAVVQGRRGLTVTGGLRPMQSERSAATIQRLAERDRLLLDFANAHFGREKTQGAADGIRRVLLRYRTYAANHRPPHKPGSADEFCQRFFESSAIIPGVDAIRKILSRGGF